LDKTDEKILRPLLYTSVRFYIFFGILLALILFALYAWYIQLTQGLAVTGLNDIGRGPPWGLYITNFIFFVGLAHGGIAISAAIRLAGLKIYKPIARIAELLTPICLIIAMFSIVLDEGRPDRLINIFLYYAERIGQSPLAWDITVVIIYFSFSTTYLLFTLRSDLTLIKERPLRWRWLYRLLLLGYRRGEEEKIEKVAWWMAACIPGLLVLLSGGVIAWLLGLMVSRPGWYGAFMGPYFVTAAIISAVAAVIVVSAIIRRIFGWQDYIRDEIFKGLGNFLSAGMFVYLYFMLAEQLTMRYPGPSLMPEFLVSQEIMQGRYAPLFWVTTIVFFFTPALTLFLQAAFKRFNIILTVSSATLILLGLWVKRYLIVVPPLLYSLLPYPIGSYTPTWVEWALIAGTFALATILYTLSVKIIPIMEVKGE
jgi:molybdopterin-containing oxidoreductase family membrane subunit